MSTTVPIIIGVTGHRDLTEEGIPELKKRLRAILDDLDRKYPATPLLVLSPLAEGADRLVAEVALEFEAELAVLLPLPRDVYEKDFETADSKKEFERLLGRATHCLVMPLAEGSTPENIQHQGEHRNRQYALAGAYIARHSQILIALWDGVETALTGGTWQIVKFKLEGIPEPYAPPPNPLDVPDSGPVYHVLTPRKDKPKPAGELFDLKVKFPPGWGSIEPPEGSRKTKSTLVSRMKSFIKRIRGVQTDEEEERQKQLQEAHAQILKRQNAFNQDARRLCTKLAAQIKVNREYVIPEGELFRLSEQARFILNQYAVADTFALHFQSLRRRTLISLFTLVVAAVMGFEAYAHLLASPWVLAIYPASLGAALGLYFYAKMKDFQNKHLDYRALAEGLRVQLFWDLSGIENEVDDHYLRQHRTELEWIRNAIRSTNILAKQCRRTLVEGEARLNGENVLGSTRDLVLRHWAEDQRIFFANARTRDHGKKHRHELVAQGLFVIGLGLAIAVAITHFVLDEHDSLWRWHHWLIVTMGTLPAIAAAMGGYAEKMVFSAQAKRYQWMAALFSRASERLKKLLNDRKFQDAQRLIFELGKEALEENGDWVMLHREREPDVRKGG